MFLCQLYGPRLSHSFTFLNEDDKESQPQRSDNRKVNTNKDDQIADEFKN